MPEKLWPPEEAIEALASRQDDPAEPSEALA